MNMNTESTVKNVIFQMLTENTGSHFLDSGGAYGRNWQRNKGLTLADFESLPDELFTLDSFYSQGTKKYYIERTVPLFSYLAGPGSNLGLDSFCHRFNSINTRGDSWASEKYYGVTSDAERFLDRYGFLEIHRPFNSYNYESDLSQVIQGSWIHRDDNVYLLLQIHGGCDVRGGYTDARLFTCLEDYCINEHVMEYEGDMEYRVRDYPESIEVRVNDGDMNEYGETVILSNLPGQVVSALSF